MSPHPLEAMTMRQRWTLTIIVFGIIGASLSIVAVWQVLHYSASRGSYEWLRGAYANGTRTYHEQLFTRLDHDAHALQQVPEIRAALERMEPEELEAAVNHAWHLKAPNEFWLAVTDTGRVLGGMPGCGPGDLAELGTSARPRFVLCRGVAAMVAGCAMEARSWRFFVGSKLDEHYVDALQKLTGTEVALLGPSGPLATTIKDLRGHRVRADFPPVERAAEPVFGKHVLTIPSYQGYLLSTRPFEVGSSSMRSYVFAASVDIEHGEIPVDLVFVVPAAIMDLGAQYSLLAQSAITLVILLVLAVVAWRLSARFARPIATLARAVERVGQGDRGVEVPVEGDEELRILGRAFNKMTHDLEESRARAVQTEKMAAIGQLAGGVAHEINNPLGVILGFAQGMERRVADGDALRLPITSIVRESLRCRALVQELLTFSRTAKRTTEEVDLNALVRSSTVLLDARAKTQGVEIVQELDDAVPHLCANKTQLQQVLVNLGTNALDAMSSGGTLTLRTRLNGHGAVVLDVQDSGTGIPEELRARIFEPFFTTKEVGKGTGLGLSLVHEIVHQHHGKIEVVSGPGKGTLISIELPPTRAGGAGPG
ncbi:MAG: HAMP domain-containing histidine kinase [Deltaproteobacteria bacterium]|nr:HAMP domain-containing histidine kinase [Deltaproteobacteria bacterium]